MPQTTITEGPDYCPSRRKAPAFTPPTPKLGDHNGFRILTYLLLNGLAGSPYSFASGSRISPPVASPPHYITKNDATPSSQARPHLRVSATARD